MFQISTIHNFGVYTMIPFNCLKVILQLVSDLAPLNLALVYINFTAVTFPNLQIFVRQDFLLVSSVGATPEWKFYDVTTAII